MNAYKIMSSRDKCYEEVKQDVKIEHERKGTLVREVRDGFSLQVTLG